MAAPPDLVTLGAVRGAYGVNGWVRVQPYGSDATLQATREWWLQAGRVGDGGNGSDARALQVTGVRRHGATVLAKWDGCDTPEAADALKGTTIAVPRSTFPPLPEGEFYWVDLIGARVVNRGGVELGTVQALRDNGAHGLLEVTGPEGTLLLPLVPSYVESVDLAARVVRVDWEAGW